MFGLVTSAHDWLDATQASATLLGVSPIASFIVLMATSGSADGKFDSEFSSGTQTYAEPARTRYVG